MRGLGLNEQIREHAVASTDWRHNYKAAKAYQIFDKLNKRFFNGTLPHIVIGFDDTGRIKSPMGEYHWEGDGLSLQRHIDLAPSAAEDEVLLAIAILHNMVHASHETYSVKKTWYHSTEFQTWMQAVGVKVKPTGEVTTIDKMMLTELKKLGINGTGKTTGKAKSVGHTDTGEAAFTTSQGEQYANAPQPKAGVYPVVGSATIAPISSVTKPKQEHDEAGSFLLMLKNVVTVIKDMNIAVSNGASLELTKQIMSGPQKMQDVCGKDCWSGAVKKDAAPTCWGQLKLWVAESAEKYPPANPDPKLVPLSGPGKYQLAYDVVGDLTTKIGEAAPFADWFCNELSIDYPNKWWKKEYLSDYELMTIKNITTKYVQAYEQSQPLKGEASSSYPLSNTYMNLCQALGLGSSASAKTFTPIDVELTKKYGYPPSVKVGDGKFGGMPWWGPFDTISNAESLLSTSQKQQLHSDLLAIADKKPDLIPVGSTLFDNLCGTTKTAAGVKHIEEKPQQVTKLKPNKMHKWVCKCVDGKAPNSSELELGSSTVRAVWLYALCVVCQTVFEKVG